MVPQSGVTAVLGTDTEVVLVAFFNKKAHEKRKGKAMCRHFGEKGETFLVDATLLRDFKVMSQESLSRMDLHARRLKALR